MEVTKLEDIFYVLYHNKRLARFFILCYLLSVKKKKKLIFRSGSATWF